MPIPLEIGNPSALQRFRGARQILPRVMDLVRLWNPAVDQLVGIPQTIQIGVELHPNPHRQLVRLSVENGSFMV